MTILFSYFAKLLTLGFLLPCALSVSEDIGGKAEKPNIIFIEVDDLNYEYLGCFGSGIVLTPNIDRLAEKGIMFRNAVAQGMMCGPSRNSTITALYPHNLGFYENGELKAIPEGTWTFPAALQRAGYYTAWIGKCHIRPGTGDKTSAMRENMGFDFVRQTEGRVVISRKAGDENSKRAERVIRNDWYLSYLNSQGLLERFLDEYPGISTLAEDEYLDGFFTQSAISFLSEVDKDRPFFLWLNYSVPHGPYDVAREYHEPYPANRMPGSTTAEFTAPPDLVRKTVKWNDENRHRDEQSGHSASVAFLDRQVGRVIEELSRQNILDKSVIVFFSDQGVMLGDHQRQHKGTLFRQVTNPALIIAGPEGFISNRVVESPVELIDLVYTALDLSNANKGDRPLFTAGYSLLPVLEGKEISIRDYAFGEIEGYVMATDGRYRLIKGKDALLLFDDLNDPKNLKNIAATEQQVVARLTEAIEKWMAHTGPVLPPGSY